MAYHMCSELVTVTWENGEDCGNLEEIGEWTALVLLENPVPSGTRLRIQCEEHQLKGFVETCISEEGVGFFVGVRLEPDSRWSEKWFAPRHLLVLQSEREAKVFPLAMASGY